MIDFKTTLLTLGDDAFFELIRNYLGAIRTPFNKHDLIARLIAFLRRDEVQDRILSMVDDRDAEVLTAIWLLDEPSHEDLFAFLEHGHSFLDLHNHLLNLEDRLLIYRDDERVGLNPELEPKLLAGIVHPARLFAVPARKGRARGAAAAGASSWLDDTLLVSLFSFLMEEPELYRADGVLRKRAADTFARKIPELMVKVSHGGEPEVLRIDFLIEALSGLGLVVEEGTRVRPIGHAWHRWARASRPERMAEVAGAGATTSIGERSDAVLGARAIVEALPEGHVLDEVGIARLASAATGVPADITRKVVQAMVSLGLLAPDGDGLRRAWIDQDEASEDPLVIQANFELTMPAGMRFADALFVGDVGELVRHDRYPRFELTKDRVAAAMRAGIGASHIADRLSSLAGGRLPQNVATSIRTWEEEYESIRLYRGIVLKVKESRQYAVDHSPAIREMIVEELAPGTYLMDEADVPALQASLAAAGVEMVPELPPADPTGLHARPEIMSNPDINKRIARIAAIITESTGVDLPALRIDQSIRGALEATLESRSMPAEQRQELSERIERKLILSDDQLRTGALKSERTEAKGLDYSGKVRVIEQSLSSGGYLEVIERTEGGAPKRRLVEPLGLRRDGNELILEGSELPRRDPVELPVSKLGLVRRLRATLFKRGPND